MLARIYFLLLPVLAAMLFFSILSLASEKVFAKKLPVEQAVKHTKTLYLSAPAEASGFTETMQLIMQAYEDIGYRAEIVPMPAKRAMHEALHGDWVDAAVGRVELAGELLNNYIRIPVPIGVAEIFVYFREDAFDELADISSWSGLSRYKVASLRGFIISSQNLAKHRVDFQQVTYARQAFEMLLRKHVDLVVLPRRMADRVLNQDEFKQVKGSTNSLDKQPVYHYLHQKHKALVPALTLSLSRLFPQDEALGNH
ncbi:transporter substrate-binding domain-containing protein [Thalassomonas actiniarum]|uniref:Transporter substrate-binding domain-containing protein n=1 Tax=Thalassomonas actiniarum TaxID=485447 RepID=A0AAF0C290_9GAMM|nr:transporter substrate-binding domain-containing protein [Thalassomonas actiniarum]WDD99801.1 transporter substrate-binding domain-containing protein [Thalassomonas actiniarum]